MSYNNTSNAQRQPGSSLADKTLNVFHLAHGGGENLRGTLLGAIDTIAKSPEGETKNDAIATKGRAEMSRAMEVLRMPMSSKGHSNSNQTAQTSRNTGRHAVPYTRTTETAGNYQSSAYADPNAHPGLGSAAAAGPTAVGATGSSLGHESTFPNHYRDDAISGLPPNQAQDLRGLGSKNEAQLPTAQYNPSEPRYDGLEGQRNVNHGAQSGYPNNSKLGPSYN